MRRDLNFEISATLLVVPAANWQLGINSLGSGSDRIGHILDEGQAIIGVKAKVHPRAAKVCSQGGLI